MGAGKDEPAIAGKIRRLRDQKTFEPVLQRRNLAGFRGHFAFGVGQFPRRGLQHFIKFAQQPAQIACRTKPPADGAEIARTTPAQHQAAAGAREIGRRFQRLANLFAQFRPFQKEPNRIQPARDLLHIGERARKSAVEQSCARGGDRQINHRQQAAASFTGQCLGQFKVAACCGINRHRPAFGAVPQRLQGRTLALLREVEIARRGRLPRTVRPG